LTVAARTTAKLELARTRGADEIVIMDGDVEQRFRDLAPEGFDVVIDATGALPVLERTIALTRTGGTIFVYGMTPEAARWPVPSYEVFRRELTIKGSFAQQFSFDRAVTALRSGRVEATGLITHRFGLDAYDAALTAVADSAVVKAALVP